MFDHTKYGPKIESILGPHDSGQRLMPLAPREPLQGEGLERLQGSSAEELLAPQAISSRSDADCVRCGLFLYLSALDESHTISQQISSSTGSFLHGIMHRQEPDFGNSKYWFRRVAGHDVYPSLRAAALDLLPSQASAAARRLYEEIEKRPQWDPFWFVDQCETAHRGGDGDLAQSLVQIQRLEWQLLFDYCYRQAVGASRGARTTGSA